MHFFEWLICWDVRLKLCIFVLFIHWVWSTDEQLAYKRWLWWTRFALVMTVLQFSGAACLIFKVIRYLSYGGESSEHCVLGKTKSFCLCMLKLNAHTLNSFFFLEATIDGFCFFVILMCFVALLQCFYRIRWS